MARLGLTVLLGFVACQQGWADDHGDTHTHVTNSAVCDDPDLDLCEDDDHKTPESAPSPSSPSTDDTSEPAAPSPSTTPAPAASNETTTAASNETTTVKGSFNVTVSDPSAILNNATAKTAFENAMATQIAGAAGNGVKAEDVSVTVSAAGSSRRLQGGGLSVSYTITITQAVSDPNKVVEQMTGLTDDTLKAHVTEAVKTVPALSSLSVTGASHATAPVQESTPMPTPTPSPTPSSSPTSAPSESADSANSQAPALMLACSMGVLLLAAA